MTSTPDTCCTCASVLPDPSIPTYSLSSEKALPAPQPPRILPCCSRLICDACLRQNPRYNTYCPYCQVSTAPTPLPQGGLREPPAYSSAPSSPKRKPVDTKTPSLQELPNDDLPPAYTTAPHTQSVPSDDKSQPEEDVIHHLRPSDTLPAVSLAYRVPLSILRSHNALFSDSLLPARRTLQIPRAYYSGPSLSATPVESEEEIERKAKLRKFMVGAKCHEYSVAELYLGNAEGDVEKALACWREDERWEREHPMDQGKGKKRVNGYKGGGLIGQLRG